MVCTAGRLISVHEPSGSGCSNHPAHSPPGNSQSSRKPATAGSLGVYRYGETPAAWTRPSKT